MNFSLSEFSLGRQRYRKWIPLITQQLRLRHLYQVIAFNLAFERKGSIYFTLHWTSMSSPFYTSDAVDSSNPKWAELELKEVNTSCSAVVIRIWQKSPESDIVLLTWGVNFSGLAYLGNNITHIQPKYFEKNAVIFFMRGGYFTSHSYIKINLPQPPPFSKQLNVIDTLHGKAIYRRVAVKEPKNEVMLSYDIEKLRKLHSLQRTIRNKNADVVSIRERLEKAMCLNESEEMERSLSEQSKSMKYTPQLLTMTSLNKMLYEKPTKFQRQEMMRKTKEIELAKFKTKILATEKDRMYASIRRLKQKLANISDDNDERNLSLMENYHHLCKESEKVREYKRSLLQHKELFVHIYSQLMHRRKQLMNELLFIYPIKKISEHKYTILDVYLPNSDILADCSDIGLSVALGYVTHLLVMSATFLQVPLRYPMTHFGSRSYVTDHISALLPDREREFPLFTKSKEKMQFTYAVYLLNKNLAQLRWLLGMNTLDLRATLPNLLNFLQAREHRRELKLVLTSKVDLSSEVPLKTVTMTSFPSTSSCLSMPSVNDPILEVIRRENSLQRSNSPPRKNFKKKVVKSEKNGKGLSEILAIPEAVLNKQMSTDSMIRFVNSERFGRCKDEISNKFKEIPIKNGKECLPNITPNEFIEEGTDVLAPSNLISKSIKIHSDSQIREKSENFETKQNRRLSRSVGSYTDEESSLLTLKTSFELGSEPLLNITCDNKENDKSLSKKIDETQHEFLEKWLDSNPNLTCSSDNLCSEENVGASLKDASSPLMARTDKLLSTKSFNLVKPK